MDAKDIRNIQEAYLEVVMNEGWKPLPTEKMKRRQERYKNKSSSPYESGISPSLQVDKRISARDKAKKIGDALSKPSTTRNPKKCPQSSFEKSRNRINNSACLWLFKQRDLGQKCPFSCINNYNHKQSR